MDTQDKVKFAEEMTAAAMLYEKKIPKELMKLYFANLQHFTIDQVLKGIRAHIQDTTPGASFMPRPADIIKKIVGTQKQADADQAVIAESQWSNVSRAIQQVGSYRTPEFVDPFTRAVVSNIGWKKLCSLTSDQLIWEGKKFITTYQDYLTRPLDQLPSHIAGREDLQRLKSDNTGSLKSLMDSMPKHLINDESKGGSNGE